MIMAQLTFLSAIFAGIFILNPVLAPAQDVQYASITIGANVQSNASFKNVATPGKSFAAFRMQYQTLAAIIQQQYPAIQDFSFDQRALLTHIFFTQNGQKMHVVFNKKNRPVLEVTTLVAYTYPELLVNTLQQDYPETEVVTIKHIQSEYGTWYEAVIREYDALKKVEIIL
jgi:hypothetical protein